MVTTASPVTAELIAALHDLLGDAAVLTAESDRAVYECDGFVIDKNRPDVVVFPQSSEQVAAIVRLCNEHNVVYVPRGAGTSLAGGCLPVGGGVMIVLTRMKEILEINLRDRYAVVESGVVNVWLTKALAGSGYHYAPDPSSQGACTLGRLAGPRRIPTARGQEDETSCRRKRQNSGKRRSQSQVSPLERVPHRFYWGKNWPIRSAVRPADPR